MIIDIKTSKIIQSPFRFKGPSGYFDYFLIGGNPLRIIVKATEVALKRNLKREVISAEIEAVLDFLSWFLDIPIRDYKIKDKRTFSNKVFSIPEEVLFGKKVNGEKYALISAYREIQNEESLALRYLMYYRLLEVMSEKMGYGGHIDELITDHKIKVQQVKNKKNPKKLLSLIRHIRNKIHATKCSYKFPYEPLAGQEKHIKKITRIIISDFLQS